MGNNGQTERQATKLKLIKRQREGKVGCVLLRQRVLHALLQLPLRSSLLLYDKRQPSHIVQKADVFSRQVRVSFREVCFRATKRSAFLWRKTDSCKLRLLKCSPTCCGLGALLVLENPRSATRSLASPSFLSIISMPGQGIILLDESQREMRRPCRF